MTTATPEVIVPDDVLTDDIRQFFHELERELSKVVIDRADEIHTVILALIAQLHWFALGEPGIAKSYMVDQLMLRIDDLDPGDYFKILLMSFTTDNEVLGGADINELRVGRVKRVIEGMLPTAKYAFMDEMYKANSAILNATLMMMNERKFRHYNEVVDVPLQVMFGASNEMPQSAELRAHWDRCTFRHRIVAIRERSDARQLLMLEAPEHPTKIITQNQIEMAHGDAMKLPVTESVRETLLDLREALKADGIEFSDRRFRQCLTVLRAEAYYQGDVEVTTAHFTPLSHVLWERPEDYIKVSRAVVNATDPVASKSLDEMEKLEQAWRLYETQVKDATTTDAKGSVGRAFYGKLKKSRAVTDKMLKDLEATGGSSKILNDSINRQIEMAQTLSNEMGIDLLGKGGK